jgi:hypothetical protein
MPLYICPQGRNMQLHYSYIHYPLQLSKMQLNSLFKGYKNVDFLFYYIVSILICRKQSLKWNSFIIPDISTPTLINNHNYLCDVASVKYKHSNCCYCWGFTSSGMRQRFVRQVVPAISNEQNAFTFHGQQGTKFFQLSRTTHLMTKHHIAENLNSQQQC